VMGVRSTVMILTGNMNLLFCTYYNRPYPGTGGKEYATATTSL
jgi:hypothetical protein